MALFVKVDRLLLYSKSSLYHTLVAKNTRWLSAQTRSPTRSAMDEIVVDGAAGEGGGQVLRTAVTLSCITGRSMRIVNIRANRPKPGLQQQHLVAVQAAARITNAAVEGLEKGSIALSFKPSTVAAGKYTFDIGTAGSTTLVLQTVLPVLLFADTPSTVMVSGGTHNPMAPPFEYLQQTLLPILQRIGIQLSVTLERHGFYPAGGGRVTASVTPLVPSGQAGAPPLTLLERGARVSCSGTAISSRLPAHVGTRECDTLCSALGWDKSSAKSVTVEASGPGNAVQASLVYEHVTEVCTALGDKGVKAEDVAASCAADAQRYLSASAPVSEHLADQLILPLALACGGQIRAVSVAAHSKHFETNVAVIEQFLGPCIEVRPTGAGAGASSSAASSTASAAAPAAGTAAGSMRARQPSESAGAAGGSSITPASVSTAPSSVSTGGSGFIVTVAPGLLRWRAKHGQG